MTLLTKESFYCPTHKCTISYEDCAARREEAKDLNAWVTTPSLEDCANCPGPPEREGRRAMGKEIICIECGEKKKHRAKGMCDSCYQVWYRRQRRNKTTPPHPDQNTSVPSILVGFGQSEDLYASLIEESQGEFRTPEQQILYFISAGLKKD